MKLKQQPEDFQVEELTDVGPGIEGPFALYRLTKRGWTTPDAVKLLRRRWKIDLRRVSYGGLKDRHALTVQYLTILHGPARNFQHQGITVEYLGQTASPFTSRNIRANRFRIVLRSLDESAELAALAALEETRRDGIANYFDDQRFGSASPAGDFVAKKLVLGQFEEALQLALAAPYEYDRAPQKKEKDILRRHWGDWKKCKDLLPRGHARSLVDYLVHHPTDFRGAMLRLRPELRGLYLSVWQSHLWNRMLAWWLRQHCRPEQLVRVRRQRDEVPMPRGLEESQRQQLLSLHLPLPTARGELDPDDPRTVCLETILREEELERKQLKVPGTRDLFFSRGERVALVIPNGLAAELGEDELNFGRRKLQLSFELPRGCYATLVVKRMTAIRKEEG